MYKHFCLAAGALFLVTLTGDAQAASFSTCSDKPQAWRGVSGKWIASVGPLELNASGNKVSGIYNQGLWALELRYSKDRKKLHGTWDHRNGLKGPVVFFLDNNGCIHHAKWGATGPAVCTPSNHSFCSRDWAIHGRARPDR